MAKINAKKKEAKEGEGVLRPFVVSPGFARVERQDGNRNNHPFPLPFPSLPYQNRPNMLNINASGEDLKSHKRKTTSP